MDLFATEANSHCRLWFKRAETSSLLGQDALSHKWPNCLLYVPSSSSSVGHIIQNISVQPQCVTCSILMASQALVSHAFVAVGGQAMAASTLKDLLSQMVGCLTSGSSPSVALGLASGTDCLVTDCEPTVIHNITSATAASTRQIYAAHCRVFSSWCEERGLDPTRCAVLEFLFFCRIFWIQAKQPPC